MGRVTERERGWSVEGMEGWRDGERVLDCFVCLFRLVDADQGAEGLAWGLLSAGALVCLCIAMADSSSSNHPFPSLVSIVEPLDCQQGHSDF